MAMIAHQTQGPCQTVFLGSKSWRQEIKLRSLVDFELVSKTAAFVPLKHRFYSRSHPINLSKGKSFQVFSFKGTGQNDESDHSDSSCKCTTTTAVQFSHTKDDRVIESPDIQNHSISYASEDGENTITRSIAIQRLFQKWLLMLRTETSSPTDEILSEKMTESETSEGNKVILRRRAGQMLKSAMVHFLNLDTAISLPLLFFIPFYLTVRMVYGVEITKELTPMWVLGPLIVAFYLKIIQGLCSLYAVCFMSAVRLAKNSPSFYLLVSTYIAEGRLKSFLQAQFSKPIEEIKNLDYKQFLWAKMKQVHEWTVERYLDYIESIWPYYCRMVRFLKKANLI